MRAWSPERRISGTATPRTSAGLVYCGYSSSPSLKDSSTLDSSLPSPPGQESHDRLDHTERRQLTSGEHEVTERELIVDHEVERPLVECPRSDHRAA